MEWVFRGLICLVSLLQGLILTSATGKYCMNEKDVLSVEGAWLKWLIIAQLSKVVFMATWHVLLNRKNQGFFEDQWDTTFFDQTTMMDETKLSERHADNLMRQGQKRITASSRLHRKRQEEESYYDDEDDQQDAME